jgi:hypothetical protein
MRESCDLVPDDLDRSNGGVGERFKHSQPTPRALVSQERFDFIG